MIAIKYKQEDMEFLTPEDSKSYREEKKIHICRNMFEREEVGDFKMRKVRCHCGYTGKYRSTFYFYRAIKDTRIYSTGVT